MDSVEEIIFRRLVKIVPFFGKQLEEFEPRSRKEEEENKKSRSSKVLGLATVKGHEGGCLTLNTRKEHQHRVDTKFLINTIKGQSRVCCGPNNNVIMNSYLRSQPKDLFKIHTGENG